LNISKITGVDKLPSEKFFKTDSIKFRDYQIEGTSWLVFLQNYGLNGILADDMGLGKTVQTLACIAKFYDKCEYSIDPVVIVAPSSVLGHWQAEINKWTNFKNTTVIYKGKDLEKSTFRKNKNFIIISYGAVRNIKNLPSLLSKVKISYCVLDEGHVIRNSKTKLAENLNLIGKHSLNRLVLSGTPVQNSCMDLFSIFDFLMPDFLGSEKEFKQNYEKAIRAGRNAAVLMGGASEENHDSGNKIELEEDCTKKEKKTLENSELAMKAMKKLHRQTLPFMLRRLKRDVLADLPPRTIIDLFVDLTPEQKKSYDVVKTDSSIDELSRGNRLLNICQDLQLDHKSSELNKNSTNGAKLDLFKQIIEEAGLGEMESSHKMIVFCQHKKLIKIIQNYLSDINNKISHLTLSGDVKPVDRQSIVDSFQQDPTIDILFLTTRIGSLGLNLTAADICVFFEHDWNPAVDKQAMDRCYRLSQRRPVTVDRLISNTEVEKKQLKLQEFKSEMADVIVDSKDLERGTGEDISGLFKSDEKLTGICDESSDGD